MNILLTGHSRGIGKWIFEEFNSIGCSKSTGYDIEKKEDRKKNC